MMSVTKTLVLITGANAGLGYYAAQQLAASGYHVLMGARDTSKAQTAIKTLVEDKSVKVDAEDFEVVEIDVTSDASIQAAAESVQKKHGHLDILMLNAGIASAQAAATDGSGPSLRELYRQHYDTNLFGAAATLEAFLPLLRRSQRPGGKRIAFTGSTLGSFHLTIQKPYPNYAAERFPIYRSTKTALNMMMLSYAGALAEEGFTVTASDPGYCATNLNNHQGYKDPRDGAKALVRAATDSGEKVHGLFVDATDVLPW